MGNDHKDRLGDKLRDLEHAREDKYFADREKELLAKMRAKAACPTCGEPLEEKEGARVCRNGHEAE